MKTDREVSERLREGPIAIVHPFCEKYFPTTIYHFREKYTKNNALRFEKLKTNFHTTVRKSPGSPHEDPSTILQSPCEKYFPT